MVSLRKDENVRIIPCGETGYNWYELTMDPFCNVHYAFICYVDFTSKSIESRQWKTIHNIIENKAVQKCKIEDHSGIGPMCPNCKE